MQTSQGIALFRVALLRVALLLAAFTLASARAAAAVPEYRLTVVGPAYSDASDINQAGVVVGSYSVGRSSSHAFLNRGGGLVDLGALGGTSSGAVAINDRGQVLGNWTTRNGQQRGFIYYQGRQRDIGAIPGQATTFTDINNAGYTTAVGETREPVRAQRSYLRAPDGRFTQVGILPIKEPLTFAAALNNGNAVTGAIGPYTVPDQPTRAFLWNDGDWRDLGDFGSTPNSGLALNDRGQVTGYASLPENIHDEVAFLYSNGRLINIDGRPPTVTRFSQGNGINNIGHVVGYSDHLSGFIYRGRRMESLNTLIAPGFGWDIRFPKSINDAGQIAATAYRNQVPYAVRLDPIRPGAELMRAPLQGNDAAPVAQSGLTPEQEALEAKAEREAQAKEVVKPVRQ